MSINLETNIKPELWSALSAKYENSHYKDAILDAMHYLTDELRSKTDLGSDGDTLAGAALGGNPPLLRINKLQTDSEKSAQAGILYIVKVYMPQSEILEAMSRCKTQKKMLMQLYFL